MVQPPLTISPWKYGDSNFAFFSQNNANISEPYVDTMLNGTGMGVRCLADDPFG